jgi:LuxR family transcriptional regulator, maltose regulon positive regulatory protein
MMKSQALTSSGIYNKERDVLLATKIAIPRISSDLLPRSHLMIRLEEATTHELTLVSTPAGFGKTTLLASWAKSTEKSVAWLSLDRDDNDPMRFWRYVVAAVGSPRRGIGESALSLLNASVQPTPKAVVTALVNEFAEHSDGFVLVLDDYHHIESPTVHDDLVYLLEQLPPGMHIVISTRSDPPMPLARFRARSQLAELRAADLRFTLEESISLLRRVWELNLPEDSIAALEERTEGWVTGLQLAALALRGATNPQQFVQEFSGSHRYILDYLTEEVLEQQPNEVRSFLLRTSVLDQLCGPLCDVLTDRSDGQQMLEDLERANLFLVPLDEERRWYRYHHLFADLLLARLQSIYPQQASTLHRNAATWYEEHRLISDAIRHALAADEAAWAARLVEQHVEEFLRRGEGETLRAWLAALPHEAVRSRPRLALAQAITAFNAGRLDVAEPLLEEAEQGLATSPEEPYEPSIGKEISMLANVPASIALLRASLVALRGDADRTTELVREAQAQLAGDERGPRISGRWNLAQADWTRGRLAEAERAFANIVAEGRQAGEPHLTLTAGFALGRIQRTQGRLEAAYHTYQQGLDFAAKTGSKVVLSTAVAHIGMAEILYERNQLEQALDHITEGISLSRQLISSQSLAIGLITLAWIRQVMGNPVGAVEAMDEANQIAQNLEIVSLYNPAPAERARLSLAQGDLQQAVRWVEARGLKEHDEPSYARELEYLVLARTMLHRNLPDRALTILEHLEASARAQQRMGSLIEIQVLQTLSFEAAGKADRAMKVLAQALMHAEPEGYIRTFVDEGPSMAALLHGAASRGVTPDYIARLLAAFPAIDQGIQPLPSSATFGFNEPLSERELEVLHLLASGASNQEIAQSLSIALTTGKKHVSNIIRKLGVNNRTQAVSRGRDLGLL